MPTYLITGANRGLGLEFVRQLAKDSSNTILAVTRLSSTDLNDVKAVSSSNTHFLTCDTSSQSSITSFASSVHKTLSGSKIDILLNNAGVNHAPLETALTMTEDALYENIRINVLGPAKITQALIEAKVLAGNVRLVNMSSGLGSQAVSLSITPRKCAPYSISKAALNALTVQQSGEVKETLKEAVVVCMDPGWVKTRMGGEGAVLEPEESIGGMLKCIQALDEGKNGKFFTYTGEEVPW